MSRLPKGFTEVEYLESTGTQYIDTDICRTDNGLSTGDNLTSFSFKGIVEYTSLGVRRLMGDSGANNGFWGIAANNKFETGTTSTYTASENTKYKIDFTATATDMTLVVNLMDGTEVLNFSRSATVPTKVTSVTFDIFALGGNFINSGTRIYKYQILINNNLMADFVPCLDASNVPCMYDKVEGKAYYNAGTGSFTYGRQIIPVEYLESTGTQYIDTGIYGTPTLETELEFQELVRNRTATGQSIFGCFNSTTENCYYLYQQGNYNSCWQAGFGNFANTTVEIDTNKHTALFSNYKLYLDGSLIQSFTDNTLTTTPQTLLLFTTHKNNGEIYPSVQQRFYSCKMRKNGVLVRDFIPCIDENNTPFMFDKVNNTVYLNAGTGQFKVGPYKADNSNKKLLRKKLALILATLKKKRKYYCEVEYLETTNQQTDAGSTNAAAYIDTGIVPNNNTRIECRMQFTTLISGQNKEALNGTTGTSPETNFRFAWGFASLSPYTNFYFGLGAKNLTTSVTRDTNVHTFVLDAKNKTCSIDDTTQSFTSSGSIDSTRSIYLFARHSSQSYANKPCNAKIYRYRNWNNDQLVQDLVPVLDWDMTPCMYDRVTEQLFYNQGTGDFTAGREIHPVEYLESTGTQWINTGINVDTSTDEIKLYFELTDTALYKWFFGEYDTNARIGLGSGDGTNLRNFLYQQSATKVSDTQMYNKQHLFEINSNGGFLDGTKIKNYANFASTSTTYLFNININSPSDYRCKSKIWRYEHKRNGVLLRDFIPAIDENGVGFMFDRVTHTIYDNAGTGAFLYPAREVEYLESTGTQLINTDITGNNDDLSFDFKYTNLTYRAYAGIFGNYYSGESYNCWRLLPSNTNDGTNYICTNTRASSSKAVYLPLNTEFVIHIDKNNYSVNGTSYTSPTTKGTNNNEEIVIFAQRSDATDQYKAVMKLNYFQIKNNDTLVRDFIPCYKDGVACMVDKLTGTAYLNQGTGSFTTGKIVEPEYE